MPSATSHPDPPPSSLTSSVPDTFYLSPLIRLTLLSLYAALTLPLPFLATATAAPIASSWLWLGLALGAIALYGALSQRVILDSQGIQVNYPRWVLFGGRWQLPWSEVVALQPRTTGQGGLVYYLVSQSGQGYLLPMRVAGFARLAARVQAETGLDTIDIKPLSQPWMYWVLLLFTGMLLLVDVWTIGTAIGRAG
jgi:hypothetical protein